MTVTKLHKEQLKCEILGIVLLSFSLLGLVSLVTPSVGVVGRLVERLLKCSAGEGRFLFPILLAFFGLRFLGKKGRYRASNKILGGLLLFIVALTLLHLTVPRQYALQAGWNGDGGGVVGGLFSYLLQSSFGIIGTYIILLALTLVGVLLSTNKSLSILLRSGTSRLSTVYKSIQMTLGNFLFVEEDEEEERASTGALIIDHCDSGALSTPDSKIYVGKPSSVKNKEHVTKPPETIDSTCQDKFEEPVAYHQERIIFDEVDIQTEEPRLCNFAEGIQQCVAYQLPPLTLLSKPARTKNTRVSKDITSNIRILEDTLESFGVKAKVTQVSRGPAITRYEIQPPAGVKVSRIVNLADDIALSMAAPDVRIEAPIPGKAAVGIEVPNREISMVPLRELLETHEFQQLDSRLTVALGKDIAGSPVLADLARMPHLLIAGATGSGKSVCLNTLIASILFKASPEQVKFLIIDPKMVELATYNGIPHLVSPVVTDPKKAATSLRWAVKEMEHRYELFANAGVRDITRYNDFCHVGVSEEIQNPLPLIVVIIDELADLMMVAPADVEDAICRLAQMARAAGIHLVVATQRPSVDVITGLIKANIPSRVSFAVSSQIDSRTILDMGGAEKLLGKGDMLFFPVGAPKPVRVQGAYLSDREVDSLVKYWKKQAEPVYEERFLKEEPPKGEETVVEDELLDKAAKIFVETGHASISLLQRRLHIGYARAARLIDIMESKGIVGGYEGSKPRSILISMEQYESMFKKPDKKMPL